MSSTTGSPTCCSSASGTNISSAAPGRLRQRASSAGPSWRCTATTFGTGLSDDSIPASTLGPVQVVIGLLDEGAGLDGRAGGCDPDRDAYDHRVVLEHERGLPDQLAQALVELPGGIMPSFGQHHHKFLAPVARKHLVLAHLAPHAPGQLLEHMVTGQVAMLVVDALEMVDVEHDQRKRTPVATAPGQLAVQVLHEIALVISLGQTIDDGHSVDLFEVSLLDRAARQEFADGGADLEQVAVAQGLLVHGVVADIGAVG